ncbi:MAG: hypothetical protein K6C94_06620 [Candidatus Gastranaerophilales bacterium]|nr:hypothetical protein [Candidatus Gastranaerophilales bacterium]
MQVQSVNSVTNAFSADLARRNAVEEEQEQQAEKPIVVDGAVRNEDGTWVGKTIDPKTGELVITTTKYNWSDKGVLDSREVTSIPLALDKEKSIQTGQLAFQAPVGVKTVDDYEHGAVSKSVITDPLRYQETKALVTVKTDAVTGEKVTTTYKPSDVEGIFNVTETDSKGNTKVISSAVKTPDGAVKIVKNMTSLDGTTTTYRYTKDASGNHIKMFNQITDKDGKVLSTIDRTYDRVDENLAFSSVNGRHYTIEQKGRKTIVTDEFLGEKTVLKKDDFQVPFYKKPLLSVLGKVTGFAPEQTKEPVIDELLHTLPGDTLLKMKDDVKYIVPIKDNLDSAFMGYFGVLNCNTDVFVVSHELGHSQDAYLRSEVKEITQEAKKAEAEGKEPKEYLKNPIADNPQFVKEYVQEKAAFIKAFPTFQEEYIDYFIFETDGQFDRGRKETVAETNAMNSQKPMPLEVLAMRTQVLQQYFPRTIAVATKIMNPIAIPEETNEHAEIILPEEKQIIVPERKIILP